MSTDKKVSGKSKDEQIAEKKQELEKRLQDVTGQLGNVKKQAKKGKKHFSHRELKKKFLHDNKKMIANDIC